jgi:hypothetical protein
MKMKFDNVNWVTSAVNPVANLRHGTKACFPDYVDEAIVEGIKFRRRNRVNPINPNKGKSSAVH